MPTVGLGRQVKAAPLPGVQKTAAETPRSMGVADTQAQLQFWGATDQVTEQIGRIGQTVQSEKVRLIAEETDRAERIGVLDGMNRLHTSTTQALYGPDGAYRKQGRDALETPETVGAAMDLEIGTITESLGTPRQRQLFQERAARMRVDVDEGLRRHVMGVVHAADVQTLQSFVTNQRDEALSNPTNGAIVQQSLDNAIGAMVDAAPAMGWDPETLKSEVAKVKTATHIGVVQELLGSHQENLAQAYFDHTAGQMLDGDAKRQLQKQLEVGDVLSDAQAVVDRVLEEGGTLDEQRQKVKDRFASADDASARTKELNGKKREKALDLIEHEAAVADRREREQEQQFYGRVYADIARTGKMPTDAVTLEKLGTHLPAIEAWVKRKEEGIAEKTNLRRWHDLMEESIHNPEKFATRNLWLDKPSLGESEFKQLELRKAGLIAGATEAARDQANRIVAGFQTHNDLVQEVLWQYTRTDERKYTAEQKDAKAQLLGQIDHWAAEEQANGVKVTNEQLRERLHDILSRNVTIPGTAWAILRPFKYDWSDQQKRVVDLTIDDISPEEQEQFAAALRAGNRAVTPQAILDLYVAVKVAPRKAK